MSIHFQSDRRTIWKSLLRSHFVWIMNASGGNSTVEDSSSRGSVTTRIETLRRDPRAVMLTQRGTSLQGSQSISEMEPASITWESDIALRCCANQGLSGIQSSRVFRHSIIDSNLSEGEIDIRSF